MAFDLLQFQRSAFKLNGSIHIKAFDISERSVLRQTDGCPAHLRIRTYLRNDYFVRLKRFVLYCLRRSTQSTTLICRTYHEPTATLVFSWIEFAGGSHRVEYGITRLFIQTEYEVAKCIIVYSPLEYGLATFTCCIINRSVCHGNLLSINRRIVSIVSAKHIVQIIICCLICCQHRVIRTFSRRHNLNSTLCKIKRCTVCIKRIILMEAAQCT